jgi:hypothetical protein
MATNFPASLDTLTNPSATDTLDSPPHDEQHADANDAIEALQAKVGVDSSAVTSSLDYRVGQLETGGGGMTVSSTAPSSPAEGDMWYDDTSGRTYVYYDDGSSQQWVEFGAPPSGIGKILQVVSAVTTTEVTTTTNGFVDTGLSATITPTSASSDILVFMTAPITMENSSQYVSVTIFRGTVASGTNLATSGTTVLANGYSASATGGVRQTLTPFVLDSPATTSATTYTGAFSRATYGTGTFCKGGNPGAYMLLMEVAS